MVARPRRLAVLGALIALLTFARPALADRVDDLARTIESDRDEKARIRAAVALGNLRDPRGVPALIHALEDSSGVVRGLAAQALGYIGDPEALEALEEVLATDGNEGVRTRARDALKSIRAREDTAAQTTTTAEDGTTTTSTTAQPPVTIKPSAGGAGALLKPKLYVIVKNMGSRGATTDRELSRKMRDTVVAELERSTELTLDEGLGRKLKSLVVDGSVSKISRGANGPWVEVTCEVKLTVSSAEGRLMSIVTGSATVQMPRGAFKTSMERNMQVEAVESAVRGAHQNLHGFLTKQVQ